MTNELNTICIWTVVNRRRRIRSTIDKANVEVYDSKGSREEDRGERNKLAKEVKRSWLRLVRMRTNKYLRETEIMIRIIKKSHPTMIIASVGEGRGV